MPANTGQAVRIVGRAANVKAHLQDDDSVFDRVAESGLHHKLDGLAVAQMGIQDICGVDVHSAQPIHFGRRRLQRTTNALLQVPEARAEEGVAVQVDFGSALQSGQVVRRERVHEVGIHVKFAVRKL